MGILRNFMLALWVLLSSAASVFAVEEVNIYSYRQPFLIEPLLKEFTADTGIKTNVLFATRGLIERVIAEGANSPADIILTTDIGNLELANRADITQAVHSEFLYNAIPEQFRDEDGHWFGLSLRARVAYVSRDRVDATSLTYEDLADPKWRGRICTRSGQHAYNLALIASMIAHHGEQAAEDWLRGLKANLARPPNGNDRAQVKAIYAGECDLALGNSYYMGKMETNEKKPEQRDWAKSVRLIFPNSEGRGSHVNLSGAVITKYAPHTDNAIKLLEFLAGGKAQKIYAEVNFEYPVRDGVEWSQRVKSWGIFKADTLPLYKIAHQLKKASELVDTVGYDN